MKFGLEARTIGLIVDGKAALAGKRIGACGILRLTAQDISFPNADADPDERQVIDAAREVRAERRSKRKAGKT